MSSPVRPDTTRRAPGYVPTPFRTGGSPADTGRGGGYVPTPFRSESTGVSAASSWAKGQDAPPAVQALTVKDFLRLGAAGAIPGWSDEIIAALRALPPDMTYAQAVTEERNALANARTAHPVISTLVELGAGIATGIATGGALKAAGLGAAGVSTIAQGAKIGGLTGAIGGAMAGSGNAAEGSRLKGGAMGTVLGGVIGAGTGAVTTGVANRLFPARPNPALADKVFDPSVTPARQQQAVAAVARDFRQGGVDPAVARAGVEGGDLAPELPLWGADLGGDPTRQSLAKAEQFGARAPSQVRVAVRARDQGRVARRDDILGRATGVEPKEFPGHVQQILDERSRVMDQLYEQARAAAEGKTVKLSTDLRVMLQTPRARQAYRDLLAEDANTVPTGIVSRPMGQVYYPPETPGELTEAISKIDASTLSRIASKLKKSAEAIRPTTFDATNAHMVPTAAGMERTAKLLERELEAVHPAFKTARETGAFYAARKRAAEEGYKLATGTTSVGKVKAAMREFDRPYMNPDGTPMGNPLDDFRTGFRSRESEVLTGKAPAIGGASVNPRPLRDEVRQAVYGEPATLMLRQGDQLEESMALTERATRGLRNAMTSSTPEASATGDLGHAAAGAGRDLAVMGADAPGVTAASWRLVQPTLNAVKRSFYSPQKMDAASDLLTAGRDGPKQLADMLRMLEAENARAMNPARRTTPPGFGFGVGSRFGGGLLGGRE